MASGENRVVLFDQNVILMFNFENKTWTKKILDDRNWAYLQKSYCTVIKGPYLWFFKLDFIGVYIFSLETLQIVNLIRYHGFPRIEKFSISLSNDNNNVYICGGFDQTNSDYFGSFNLGNYELKDLEPFPIKVCGLKSIYYKDNIYCFGGLSDYGHLNHLYQYNIKNNKWYLLETMNDPPGRYLHGMCELNGCIYIFGGINKKERVIHFGDIWCLDINSNISHLNNLLEFSEDGIQTDIHFNFI